MTVTQTFYFDCALTEVEIESLRDPLIPLRACLDQARAHGFHPIGLMCAPLYEAHVARMLGAPKGVPITELLGLPVSRSEGIGLGFRVDLRRVIP